MRNIKKIKVCTFKFLVFSLIFIFITGFSFGPKKPEKNEYAGAYYGDNLEYTIGEMLATVKGGKWETKNGFVRFIIPAREVAWRTSMYQLKKNSDEVAKFFALCAIGSMSNGKTDMQCLDNVVDRFLADLGYQLKNASKVREIVLSAYPEFKAGFLSSNGETRTTSIVAYGIYASAAVMLAKLITESVEAAPVILQFEDERDNKFSIRSSRGEKYDDMISDAFLGTEVKNFYLPIYGMAEKINTMK